MVEGRSPLDADDQPSAQFQILCIQHCASSVIMSLPCIQLWTPHLCLQGWNTLQEREQITRPSLTLLLVNLFMHRSFGSNSSFFLILVLNCFFDSRRCLEVCHWGVGHWGLDWGCVYFCCSFIFKANPYISDIFAPKKGCIYLGQESHDWRRWLHCLVES